MWLPGHSPRSDSINKAAHISTVSVIFIVTKDTTHLQHCTSRGEMAELMMQYKVNIVNISP